MDAPLQQSISPKEAQKVVNKLGETLANMLGLVLAAGRRGEVEQKLVAVRAAAVPGRLVHSQLEELDILVNALRVSLADSLVEVGTLSTRAVAYAAKAVTAMAELEVENRRGNELELENAELQTQQMLCCQLSDDVIQQLVDMSPGWTMNFDETVRPITWTWEWRGSSEVGAAPVSLLSLPAKLLDEIASYVPARKGKGGLAATCRVLFKRIAPGFYPKVHLLERNVAKFVAAKIDESRGPRCVRKEVRTKAIILHPPAGPWSSLSSLLQPIDLRTDVPPHRRLFVNCLGVFFTDFALDVGFWQDLWPLIHPTGLTFARARSDPSIVTLPSTTIVPQSSVITLSERTKQVYFLGEGSIPVLLDVDTGRKTIAVVSAAGRSPDMFYIVRVPRGEGGKEAGSSDWFGLDRLWDEVAGVVVQEGDGWIGLAAAWSTVEDVGAV